MGFLEYLAAGAAPAPVPDDAVPSDALLWSRRSEWGGESARAIRIEAGRTVLLDEDLNAESLRIEGTLQVARRDIRIRASWILVVGEGRLLAGSTERPFRHRLTITLARAPAEAHPLLGSQFLAALDGGSIDLHGDARRSWVPLGGSTAPGHDTLRLDQPVDWRAGERIAVASGADHALVEERTIEDVGTDCMTVRLAVPMKHRHHGKQAPLKHVLPGSIGKAVLLERNIVVEGCESSERDCLGAYCLIAGTSELGTAGRHSIGRFSSVEFRRMGQFNRPGRYPIHVHNNGEAADSAVVGCLIHQSYQRGIVTVGSQHVRISGNVVVKPYGHGYIVESVDNSPQLVTTNLALRPRVMRFADQAMRSYCEHRPRAFWIVQSHATRVAAH